MAAQASRFLPGYARTNVVVSSLRLARHILRIVRTSMTERSFTFRWAILVTLLFAGPVHFWVNEPPSRRLLQPLTPVDLTLDHAARQWTFLASAEPLLPRGATVTVQAADPDDEMSLYMLALGLFPRNTVVPESYWGRKVEPRMHADYELSFGCTLPQVEGQALARVTFGCMRKSVR